MKLDKSLFLFVILIYLTACDFIPDNNKELISKADLSHMTFSISDKQMPAHLIIDPLPQIELHAKSAILINAATGEVLLENNIHESLPIASMSKIMTELLVLEAIEAGKLNWEDSIKISDYAYTISNHPGYASVKLRTDEFYTIRELFYAMAISSENGATIALAEAVSGSERDFVGLMNERANELGLDHTTFVNSSGLTNNDLLGNHSVGGVSDANEMSAYDLSLLAMYLIKEFPEILDITTEHGVTFHEEEYNNSNWMLPGLTQDYTTEDLSFAGVDGLKTGFTDIAGYCFTGTVEVDGRRFISVLMGYDDIIDRFSETKLLYQSLTDHLNK